MMIRPIEQPMPCLKLTGISETGRPVKGAITTAASLHLSLASPNTEIFEYKPFGVVVQDDLVAEKLWHRDGWAYPIHGPGLGIDVQESVVKRLAMA